MTTCPLCGLVKRAEGQGLIEMSELDGFCLNGFNVREIEAALKFAVAHGWDVKRVSERGSDES